MPTICNFTKNKIFQQVYFESVLHGYQNHFLTTNSSTYLPTYWPTDRPTDRLTHLPTHQSTHRQTHRPTNQRTNQPTNSPTNWLTNQPTNQSINRSFHLSINIHLDTYIHFFFHFWLHCWPKHEKEEQVVAWKTWFHSFERQKHKTKNDISSQKTCHNTIWTLVKLGSIF